LVHILYKIGLIKFIPRCIFFHVDVRFLFSRELVFVPQPFFTNLLCPIMRTHNTIQCKAYILSESTYHKETVASTYLNLQLAVFQISTSKVATHVKFRHDSCS
jgi:hypothetical protein